MFRSRCPRVTEIQALALHQPVSRGTSQHVESCEICSVMLSLLEAHHEVIGELKESLIHVPDDVNRMGLIEHFREAFFEARRRKESQDGLG